MRAALLALSRLAGGGLLACCAVSAHAEVDLKQAAAMFATHCSECHSVKEGKDKKGPSLFGIVGRKAATNPSFFYSEPMRASGLTWNAAALDRYITAPGTAVPGGKMKYDGLAKADERELVIQYLASVSTGH
jgi:cytochrome c